MDINREQVPPCSLYCGVCSIMMAYRDDNPKFKQKLAELYHIEPEDIRCEGCLAPEDKVFAYCRTCPIKSCTGERGIEGCHQCDDFPCEHITGFMMPVGVKVMLRAVPRRREIGTDAWVEEEELRYHCPECDYPLFRGAKRCRQCGIDVDVD
jgi:hypothetical protein